jgi:hypothetical protein
VPLAGIVHQPHVRVKSWSQDDRITCVGMTFVVFHNTVHRYRFTVSTIQIAKEDSLLFPPELVHDPERRCDQSRT